MLLIVRNIPAKNADILWYVYDSPSIKFLRILASCHRIKNAKERTVRNGNPMAKNGYPAHNHIIVTLNDIVHPWTKIISAIASSVPSPMLM
tara:strand:+ start:4185 stop:4457 length:273 start_codon:yes stop_codon:yes gene_type:complete